VLRDKMTMLRDCNIVCGYSKIVGTLEPMNREENKHLVIGEPIEFKK
jgi:hypothetical protein